MQEKIGKELIAAWGALVAKNRLMTWSPYPWQKEFYDSGAYARERLLMAANGCITPWTKVETAPQSRRIVDILSSPSFDVRSWDGESECVERASGAFLKSIEPAFRFLLDNGEWFDGSCTHKVLTSEGWFSLDQIVRLSSGLRLRQTAQDFLASCGADDRLCDSRLLSAANSGQSSLRLQADAQIRAPFLFSLQDVAERIPRCSHAYPSRDRFSIDGYARRIAGLCEQFVDPSACIGALQQTGLHRALRQLAAEWRPHKSVPRVFHHRFSELLFGHGLSGSFCAGDKPAPNSVLSGSAQRSVLPFSPGDASLRSHHEAPHIETFFPSDHPELVGGRRVVAVVPLYYQPILDFTVHSTHCYLASGVIHHNTGKTVSIAAETAMHASGQYPHWWKGFRMDRGDFTIWLGSIDNDMQKIGLQPALLGPDLDEGLGSGFIPAHAIMKLDRRQAGVKEVADEVLVRHASGGRVKLKFKTYEQGWRRWQSGDPKIIVWDEEPDEGNVEQKDIHAEVLTRLVRNNGIFIGGYTPLLGETQLTMHFMNADDPSIRYFTATWDDAPHMDQTAKDRAIAGYPEHQRETRSMGIPMMGEGRIFTAPESAILCDPIEIPNHWARIIGIDFGLAHPAAIVCWAWDRDADIVYLYDCWRQANVQTRDHAHVINSRGKWIPVAWPHDGEKRDPRSGEAFHRIYRKRHEVNMLSRSARYKNDVGGAQPQWPIIEEVRLREDSSRIKIFRTCREWIEERRSYHTKDGKIVARRDDVLKAGFYGLMMLRYAISRNQGERLEYARPGIAPFRTAAR